MAYADLLADATNAAGAWVAFKRRRLEIAMTWECSFPGLQLVGAVHSHRGPKMAKWVSECHSGWRRGADVGVDGPGMLP